MKEEVELDVVMACVARQCPTNHLKEVKKILNLK
jgi:hypothetical protein